MLDTASISEKWEFVGFLGVFWGAEERICRNSGVFKKTCVAEADAEAAVAVKADLFWQVWFREVLREEGKREEEQGRLEGPRGFLYSQEAAVPET